MTLDEAAFRALLDARGILDAARASLVPFPSPEAAYTVFAQRADARIELASWKRHAEQFVDTRLGLTVAKKADDAFPARDVARVVLAPVRERAAGGGAQGTRTCWGRPRSEEDLRLAREAEGAAAGLADLAARCAHVWLVEIEGDEDLVALRLAAIIAGVVLGPILAPRGAPGARDGAAALLGPKTARLRLA